MTLLHTVERGEICRIGRSLFERGYVHATAGNISVRLPDGHGFLITPTDACLGFLEPAQLSHVDIEGHAVGGERASKTLALHRRIYAAEPSAHCIVHTHSTHAVALTFEARANGDNDDDDALPPITPYFVMKVGHVPLVPYHRPGDPAVARLVADRIALQHERGVPIRAVLLERLGPLVWHETPAAAMATLEELEETARLWLMTNTRSGTKAAPLSAAQIEELRATFGARW